MSDENKPPFHETVMAELERAITSFLSKASSKEGEERYSAIAFAMLRLLQTSHIPRDARRDIAQRVYKRLNLALPEGLKKDLLGTAALLTAEASEANQEVNKSGAVETA